MHGGATERAVAVTLHAMRRRIALLVFIALAIISVSTDAIVFRIAFANRAEMHRAFTLYPDRGWNEYPKFLEGVRARTQPGDSIAIVAGDMHWDAGYSYAYYRASYFLTGREVLPLVSSDDVKLPANFARAKYIASWHRNVNDATRHIVWSGDGGVLLGR